MDKHRDIGSDLAGTGKPASSSAPENRSRGLPLAARVEQLERELVRLEGWIDDLERQAPGGPNEPSRKNDRGHLRLLD